MPPFVGSELTLGDWNNGRKVKFKESSAKAGGHAEKLAGKGGATVVLPPSNQLLRSFQGNDQGRHAFDRLRGGGEHVFVPIERFLARSAERSARWNGATGAKKEFREHGRDFSKGYAYLFRFKGSGAETTYPSL